MKGGGRWKEGDEGRRGVNIFKGLFEGPVLNAIISFGDVNVNSMYFFVIFICMFIYVVKGVHMVTGLVL